ncbi:MAG: glycosyltransferase [Clostridia bacterium]|nr:glycosyltransferase [Clostridia bacterium]
MAQRMLFLSTKYTGHGHQSITDSVNKQIAQLNPEARVDVVESFDLGGKSGKYIGRLYGPVTHYAKPVWASSYQTAHRLPGLANNMARRIINKDKLLAIINETKPELIVTVHPAFVGSVITLLQKQRLDIPVVTLVADLISINRLWADKRALYTICPSEEAKERVIRYGVPAERAKVFGFPVREKFYEIAAPITEEALAEETASGKNIIDFLIVSGAEGSGNLVRTAHILLQNFDCRVTIITGRNQKLKSMLENSLGRNYPQRAVILGFVHNIEEYLMAADILITRASPNTLMEAVTCCVPLIVTDAVPGQEKENPDFVQKHNLGVICRDLTNLPREIRNLLADNGRRLLEIRRAQFRFRDLETNQKIARFLLSI